MSENGAQQGENTALLVMDFQNGILIRMENDDVYERAYDAVEAARAASIPVIFVRVAFRPGMPEVSSRNQAFAAVKEHGTSELIEGSWGAQLAEGFERRDDEPIVTKRRYGAFTGSDLGVLLRGYNIQHLVIAGISTSGVVLSTVRAAADLDYRMTVLADACGDRDPEIHDFLIEKILPSQANITTVGEWATSLTK